MDHYKWSRGCIELTILHRISITKTTSGNNSSSVKPVSSHAFNVAQNWISFDLYETFARGYPHTQTPTQKLKSRFSMTSSQDIGSSSVSFQMIFQAPQPEIVRFQFYSLCSEILKIAEITLSIFYFDKKALILQ